MNFQHLTTEAEIRSLIDWHNHNSEFVVIDSETTGLNPRQCKLIDIQMSGVHGDSAVLFSGEFVHLLRDIRIPQVYHNFRFDWKVFHNHGVDLRGKPVWDTMLLHHLLDENADHSLDSIVQEEFKDDYKERFWAEFDSYEAAPFDRRLDYACRDVVYTQKLFRSLRSRLRADSIPDSLCDHVHRLALALYDTELEGIKVDLPYTIQMGTELKGDIVRTEAELRRLGGWACELIELDLWRKELEKYKTDKKRSTVPKPTFNFNASGQVCSLLYDQLGLPAQFNKKTRSRTADDKALEALGEAHPILPEIRKLRKLSKMYGAFVESILEKAEGDRIYPSFNVNGTVTGRISHSEPNMGQMPAKGDWAKIRGIFVPQPGYKLITCDYGMLEVVIAAHFSQDKNLLRIIHEGASKHDITAEGVGLPRHVAKTLNFAAQYQCSWQKVKDIVGCSDEEAQGIYNKYWETYAGERRVIDACNRAVDAGNPIINPLGRKRRFPSRFSSHWERAAAHRQAYSSLIQGTGSDITSAAFYRISEKVKAEGWGRAWFTVHDEIIAEVKEDAVEQAREFIQATMLSIGPEIGLTVPLTVDCSPGLDRWQK